MVASEPMSISLAKTKQNLLRGGGDKLRGKNGGNILKVSFLPPFLSPNIDWQCADMRAYSQLLCHT